jgi:hypothetical protein
MSVFLQPIYTQTVGSGGTGGITFNNIPQTFTDLMVYSSTRNTTSGIQSLYLRLNNDGTALYSDTIVTGNNGGSGSGGDTGGSAGIIGVVPDTTYTSNTFSNDFTYLPNYTSSNFKQYIADGTAENNSSTAYYLRLVAGLYRSTNAITSLTVLPGGGNFAQYSTFSLYGVLRAGI